MPGTSSPGVRERLARAVLPPLPGAPAERDGRRRSIALVLAVLFVVIGLPGLLISGRGYARHHLVEAVADGRLHLDVHQGETISLGIRVPGAVAPDWATDGLALTSDQLPTGIPLVAPKAPTWGDSISVAGPGAADGSALALRAIVTVPVLQPGRTVSGTGSVTGRLTYPRASASRTFTDESVDLAIPTDFVLRPEGAGDWSRGTDPLVVFLLVDAAIGGFFIASAILDHRRLRPLTRDAAARSGIRAGAWLQRVWPAAVVLATGSLAGIWTFAWADLGASGLILCWAQIVVVPSLVFVLVLARGAATARRRLLDPGGR